MPDDILKNSDNQENDPDDSIGEEIEEATDNIKKKTRAKKSKVKKTDIGEPSLPTETTLEATLPDASEDEPPKIATKKDVFNADSLDRLELHNMGIKGIKTPEDVKEKIYPVWEKELGITKISQLNDVNVEVLSEATPGVGEGKAAAILNKASTLLNIPKFVPMGDLPTEMMTMTTGSANFDDLLGGGIAMEETYMAFGPFGTGKTQLITQVCVTVQLPVEKGGMYVEGQPRPQVLMIDSEDTFRQMNLNLNRKGRDGDAKKEFMSRITAISNRFGIDPKIVLDNIIYCQVVSVDDQKRTIEQSLEMYAGYRWKLIIVDSINNLVRSEFHGRPELSEQSSTYNGMIKNLFKLKQRCQAAVICTAQIYTDPNAQYKSPDDLVIVAGGGVLQHGINVQIQLKKVKKGVWNARIKDASYLDGQESIQYAITERGIEDI